MGCRKEQTERSSKRLMLKLTGQVWPPSRPPEIAETAKTDGSTRPDERAANYNKQAMNE